MTVALAGITKTFGSVRANDGVDLIIGPGELVGVLGENGAGKSTLMKILSGFQAADSGSISVDGAPIALGSPADAEAAGIGMLHQDPLVFLPMTVLENFMLANPAASDRRRARADLAEMSSRFGFSLDPDTPVRRLSVGERQQLEMLRLISQGVRLLILDEPTTAISVTQRAALFSTLRTLATEGTSVVFVSHKLDEVEDLCARVVVMRAGRVVGERAVPVSPRPAGRADVRHPDRARDATTVHAWQGRWPGWRAWPWTTLWCRCSRSTWRSPPGRRSGWPGSRGAASGSSSAPAPA